MRFLTVSDRRVSPARVTIVIEDGESDEVELLFQFRLGSEPSFVVGLPQNPIRLSTSPGGQTHVFDWNFIDEEKLPSDGALVEGVSLEVQIVGQTSVAQPERALARDAGVGADAASKFSLGNDPPEWSDIDGDGFVDTFSAQVLIHDSSSDEVTILAESAVVAAGDLDALDMETIEFTSSTDIVVNASPGGTLLALPIGPQPVDFVVYRLTADDQAKDRAGNSVGVAEPVFAIVPPEPETGVPLAFPPPIGLLLPWGPTSR